MNPTFAKFLIPLLPIAANFVALAVQTFVEVLVCGQGAPQEQTEGRVEPLINSTWPTREFVD